MKIHRSEVTGQEYNTDVKKKAEVTNSEGVKYSADAPEGQK
jgi:hypothetical protein